MNEEDDRRAGLIRDDAVRALNAIRDKDPWHILAVCGHMATAIFGCMKREYQAKEITDFTKTLRECVDDLNVQLRERAH